MPGTPPDAAIDPSQSPPPPPPPRVVAGRYRLDRVLGRGGMATVHLAHDERHDALVAIKLMHGDLVSVVASDRFQREVRLTARLQHPHILPVLDSGVAEHDAGNAGGRVPFYTMPYVRGETLADRIARERQLPVADAVRITRQIADALAYAHHLGVVHRDIKPSNILLAGYPPERGTTGGATSEWYAMLADFGIARAIDTSAGDRLTDSGLALGTALYMSPEQSSADAVDGRSDVYSLGCVLYEMLAGAPPFHGPTPQAILARHAVDPVPRVHTVRATVGPALEGVIAQALAKVPADRFVDAAAFRDALAAVEQGTSGAVPSTGAAPIDVVSTAAAPTGGMSTAAAPTGAPPATRPASPRRSRFAGLGALAVAATAFALWRGASPSTALDESRVMVFPLRVSADARLGGSAGEDVATAVGNAVDGVERLRWIDGWRDMTAAQRADAGSLAGDDALSLARARRCGYFVRGSITPLSGDSVTVRLDLVRTRDDESVKTGTAHARRTDAWRAGLGAVNELLPTLIPGATNAAAASRKTVSEWATRPPAAVAEFLAGEAAFRRVRPADALGHYRDAVARDSTFALAALRGAQAASWSHVAGEVGALVQVALRQPLSDRYRHFASGTAAFDAGLADSAAAELRRAVAADPEMAVAWLQLGEVYTHLLPVEGDVDSAAADAFRRARAIDSSAADHLLHPIELAVRAGDVATAKPLAARLLAAAPDSGIAHEVEWLVRCAEGGPSKVDWADAVRRDATTVLQVARQAGLGAQRACAEAAYGAVLREYPATAVDAINYRWPALVGLQGALVARGATAAAVAQLDSGIVLPVANPLGGESVYLIGAGIVPAYAGPAQRIAARDSAAGGASSGRSPAPARLGQLAVWAASTGRGATAAAIADELDRRLAASADAVTPGATPGATPASTPASTPATDSALIRTARSAAALAAAATARTATDTVAAIAALTTVLAAPMSMDALAWSLPNARAAERLLLARLLAGRGEHRRALAVASVFDSVQPLIHVMYLPASLELRRASAAALRDADLAARFSRRIAAGRAGTPAAAP